MNGVWAMNNVINADAAPTGAPSVGVSLINFQRGGLHAGEYRFQECAAALAAAPDYCDLVIMCEAREYAWRGGEGKYGFTNTLASASGRPLVCELGVSDRGEFGPLIVYDPRVLGVGPTFHGYGAPLPHEDKRNFCNMFLRANGALFGVLPVHWDYQNTDRRLAEAKMISWVAGVSYPVLVAGDFNGVASGARAEVTRDFRTMPLHKRFHKGQWWPRTSQWRRSTADTRALDFLLGTWRPSPRILGRPRKPSRRTDGIGMVDLAEIAAYTYREPNTLLPTVHPHVDGGSGLRIDRALVNPAGAGMLAPGSFRVETTDAEYSDHRIVRFQLHPDIRPDARRDGGRQPDRRPEC